jgi:hypothetical protein
MALRVADAQGYSVHCCVVKSKAYLVHVASLIPRSTKLFPNSINSENAVDEAGEVWDRMPLLLRAELEASGDSNKI